MNRYRFCGCKSLCIALLTFCGILLWSVYFFHGDLLNIRSQIISTFEQVQEPKQIRVGEQQITQGIPSPPTEPNNLQNTISQLSSILEKKITAATIKKVENLRPSCDTAYKLANSCENNKCLQKELPENITARVEQLVAPRLFQLSPEEHGILSDMSKKVNGSYDIILLTAASSNHYYEAQALVKNLHQIIYPHLTNFTLIFYNLGLTEHERDLLIKHCKCLVIDFPFDKFPSSMKLLGCYSWKSILIKSHLQNANVVFWMDSSVRFKKSMKNFDELIKRTRERGIQIGYSDADSPFRTYRSMYHFFGDEPCAYLKYGQTQATYGVYNREYFVDRAILEPWVACSINKDCMCPKLDTRNGCSASFRMVDNYKKGGPIIYGLCHRFDQSALSLIAHKLFLDIYPWVMVDVDSVLTVSRGSKAKYFPGSRK